MSYRCTHFIIQELVSPEIFRRRGEHAWELLDSRILASVDSIRTQFGITTVNDWHKGGNYHHSGFREAEVVVGAELSQHRFGRALDVKCRDATPEEVHAYILEHPQKFAFITTLEAIEDTPTWVHIDCRNNGLTVEGIRIVKP